MESTTSPVAARPASPTRNLWDQQAGENDLWYARFLRFVALGPGRSVSLVATGRRNAYPVPAHWPIQAKQRSWRERATAFDAAAKLDPTLVEIFNNSLSAFATGAVNGEAPLLEGAIKAGGYRTPPPDDDLDGDDVEPLAH